MAQTLREEARSRTAWPLPRDRHTDNPDAEPVPLCKAARPAIVVYGKRVGATLTVCTDNDCPIHDPRAAARAAEHPAPVMSAAPPAETKEEAEERKQQHEQQRRNYEAEQQRRAEECRQQEEHEEQEREAEFTKRDSLRKKREASFELIIAETPSILTAAQLRVILRALVNLDPYTLADDLAVDLSVDCDNEKRSAEEILLSAIEATEDDKLTSLATRLALSGHRGIPHEDEIDFLTEAEAAFLLPETKKNLKPKKKPMLIKTTKIAKGKGKAARAEEQPRPVGAGDSPNTNSHRRPLGAF